MGDPLDRAFDALSASARRRVLLALLNHSTQDGGQINPLEALGDEEVARLQTTLHHVHLPKLDEQGYIDWDRKAGLISKGKRWDEVAPLLKLINTDQDTLFVSWS